MDYSVKSGFYFCHLQLQNACRGLSPLPPVLWVGERKTTSWSSPHTFKQPPLPSAPWWMARGGPCFIRAFRCSSFLPSQGWPFAYTHCSTPCLLHPFQDPQQPLVPLTCHLGQLRGLCHTTISPLPARGWAGDLSWGQQAPLHHLPYSQPSHADACTWMKGSETFPTADLTWGRISGKRSLHTCLLISNPLPPFPNPSFLFPSAVHEEKKIPSGCSFHFKSFIF